MYSPADGGRMRMYFLFVGSENIEVQLHLLNILKPGNDERYRRNEPSSFPDLFL